MKEKKYTLFSNIRYMYQMLYQVKPTMRLGVYGTIFFYLAGRVAATVTMAAAVASITEKGRVSHYLLVMAVMLAVYLFCHIGTRYVDAWSNYYYETAQNREFLMQLVQKSLHADYDNVESPEQQRLLTRATHAVNMYWEGVNRMYINCPLIVAAVMGIILYSLTISFFDWRIMAVIVVMSIVGSLLEARYRKYRATTMDEQYRIWGRFFYLKQQMTTVENGKDIRIYNMADWLLSGFDKLERRNMALSAGYGRRRYTADVSDALFVAARDLLAYGILTAGVLNGSFSIAEFTLGLGVVTGLAEWFGNIRFHIGFLLEGNLMICEYRKMMDYPNRFLREEGMPIPAAWYRQIPEITFENVSFRYEEDGEEILKDISFSIRPGERIALVGSNGAGKTTLVKLLCGFYHPTGGRILIGGHSIEELNLNEYHVLLAVIFQDINSVPISIASNVSGCVEEDTDMEKVRFCLRRAGLWKDVEALEKKELTNLTHP